MELMCRSSPECPVDSLLSVVKRNALRGKPPWFFRVFHDNAASDLITGVSGRLCGEIVGCAVDDQGAADDLRQFKSIRVDDAVGKPSVTEKRGQVTGVFRMGQSAGIVMCSGFVKRE